MLIQTESNVQGKPKTNEVLKVKKETDYIENIETITNSKENNENTDNLPIKKKTNKQENNNEEKELFEMYQKLEKIFKKEETSPSENIPFNSQEQPQPLIQQIFQQPQKEFLQNPTQKILKLPQQQPQQRLILSNSNNPYILQPVMVQQNPIQYTNNYQQIPQEMNYGYVDYNGYNSNDLQNNVRYVTVQKPQQKIIVLPEKQLPQQIVYVNNEGQIVY